MATPPTFVAEYEVAHSRVAAGAKTVSVTVAAGDVLAIYGLTEDGGLYTLGTPSGGGLTYSLQQSVTVSSYCAVYVWTATAGSSQTFTLSITMSGGTAYWGYDCLRFSGSDGVGNSSKTNVASGAPSLALTTAADNSAIVAGNGDWNAGDGSSRMWRTINSITPTSGNGLETTYARDASYAAFYGAYWSDSGTAGSKTTGLSAPSGQKYAVVAVEIKGTAGGATVNGDASLAGTATVSPTAAVDRAASSTVTTTVTATPTAALSMPATGTITATATVTPTAAVGRPATSALTGTATIAATANVDPAAAAAEQVSAVIAAAATTSAAATSAITITATITVAATVGAAPVDISAAPTIAAGITPTAAVDRPATAAPTTTVVIAASTAAGRAGSAAVTTAATIAAAAAVERPIAAAFTALAVFTADLGGAQANAASAPLVTASRTATSAVTAGRSSTSTITGRHTSTPAISDG